jgi:hypothetical protein
LTNKLLPFRVLTFAPLCLCYFLPEVKARGAKTNAKVAKSKHKEGNFLDLFLSF